MTKDKRRFMPVRDYARKIGIDERTLRNRINKYGLRTKKIKNGNREIIYVDATALDHHFEEHPIVTNQRRHIKEETKAELASRDAGTLIKGKTKETIATKAKAKIPSPPPLPVAGELESLPSVESEEDNLPSRQDFNPLDYPEAWIRDEDGNPRTFAGTDKIMLDYDRLKKILVVLNYDMEYKEKTGRLVPRAEFIGYATMKQAVLNQQLSQLPTLVTEAVISVMEKSLGREVDANERTALLDAVGKIPERFMAILNSAMDDEVGKIADITPEGFVRLAKTLDVMAGNEREVKAV